MQEEIREKIVEQCNCGVCQVLRLRRFAPPMLKWSVQDGKEVW